MWVYSEGSIEAAFSARRLKEAGVGKGEKGAPLRGLKQNKIR
jgi:hypothetical protein